MHSTKRINPFSDPIYSKLLTRAFAHKKKRVRKKNLKRVDELPTVFTLVNKTDGFHASSKHTCCRRLNGMVRL